MALRRGYEPVDVAGLPPELRGYRPEDWCDDPGDPVQARYFGVHAYCRARVGWLAEHRPDLSRDEARRAAADGSARAAMRYGRFDDGPA